MLKTNKFTFAQKRALVRIRREKDLSELNKRAELHTSDFGRAFFTSRLENAILTKSIPKLVDLRADAKGIYRSLSQKEKEFGPGEELDSIRESKKVIAHLVSGINSDIKRIKKSESVSNKTRN